MGLGRKWSKKELKILKLKYPVIRNVQDILKDLDNRNLKSVYAKAVKLKLSRINSQYSRGNSDAQIKCKYGLTPEDWDLLYEQQQGCCAICGKHQSELKRRLDVDHNHKTKEVRGLLCRKCNVALGLLNVDIKNDKLLVKTIEYLKG